MDLSEQGRSARSRHAAAEDKGQTCTLIQTLLEAGARIELRDNQGRTATGLFAVRSGR